MVSSTIFEIKISNIRILALFTICAIYCWVVDKTFVTLDAESVSVDGYAAQVYHIKRLIENGGNLLDEDLLYWIHSIRALTALTFIEVHDVGGSLATAFLVLACVLPLFTLFDDSTRPKLAFVLPFMLLVLSYRSVLVFVSIGYLLLYIINKRSAVFLLLSYVFANLSSGAVYIAVVIVVLICVPYRRFTPAIVLYTLLLIVSLGVSLLDKYAGFNAQLYGYDSTVAGAEGIYALLSRSTVFISVMEGNYQRAAAYTLLLCVASYAFLYALFRRQLWGYAAIFSLTAPAFFLEGLGVVALLVPVLMFLAGAPLVMNLRIKNASAKYE